MPRQLGNPEFTADERLFRHLREDWLDGDGRPTEEAVDLLATSVDRERFVSDPETSLARAAAHFVAVTTIVFCDIPDRFEAPPDPPNPPPMPCESVVEYCPENGNNAHSEIQFWRVGGTKKSKPKSAPLRSEIRERLIEIMRGVHRRR